MTAKNSPLRDALDETNIILGKFHAYLKSRNTFPHKDQSEVIRAFFNDKKKIIQGQCGRSFGKTHVILYIAWRFALTNPGSEVYIVCPENAQGKRIYWISRRLQTYGNQEFVSEHRDSELRTVFKNGSHIMIVGCENYEALRGIKPHLVIYDEFQHHSSFFDEEVMQPNLSSGKVSLVVMGTPPKRHCYYVEFRKQLLDNIQSGDKGCYYVELPSTCNPTVDKIWVHKKKIELQKKGKINVYLREYEGKLLFDTEHAIFPFFDEFKHKKPHAYIMELLKRDKRKLDWYTFYDPGTASVFGGLFIAVNRYTSQIFILDEIYATEKNKMTARSIWIDSEQKRKDLYADSSAWSNYYDEAETWFANEINSMFNVGLIPTHKSQYESRRTHDEGRAGESILNEVMMLENRFFVSDRCIKFIWELTNYVTDEQGKYPRKHDHLMDLLIYFINEAHFELYEEVDYEGYEETRRRETFRGETIEQMLSSHKRKNDITFGIEPDYYDDMGDEYGWN